MAQHNELGKKGEQLAVDFLIKKGYAIIAQNYYYDKAEIDILAKKDNILAVVEVKTRSTSDFGNPQDFVNKKKIQLLLKAVNAYIDENDLKEEVRFDIVAIIKRGKAFEIEHLEDAFYHF